MIKFLQSHYRTRLVFALILGITITIAIVGVRRIAVAKEALRHLSTDEIDRQVLVERWSFETRLNLLRTTAALRARDAAYAGQLDAEAYETGLDIDRTEALLKTLVPEPVGQRLLAEIAEARRIYRASRHALALRSRAGEDVIAAVDRELEPLVQDYIRRQQALNTYIDRQLTESQASAARKADEAERLLEVGAALATVLGIAFAVFAAKSEQSQLLAARRMRHMAHHDPLTGLPNRTVITAQLKAAIERAARHGHRVTVAFIDLEGFKGINDSLGHAIGDRLLKLVGERIVRSVRISDTAVRIGGDEFAILFDDRSPTPPDTRWLLGRIVSNVADVASIEGQEVQVTCSIGVATFPEDGADDETLLQNADAAMYAAKALGGNRFEYYRKDMNADNTLRFRLQVALGSAIARDELFVVYQPQLELASNRIIGVEALLRWRHPRFGLVSPAEFIPVAEQTGLIGPIGEWVLRQACQQRVKWQALGLPAFSVAVNVSARQFRGRDFVAQVARILAETGLAASSLELELTESMLMHDVDAAVALMHELTATGIQLSIDDFGTGYSSLGALKTFPISRLKIDKAFVQNVATDELDQALASAIIALGHRLKLKVIAEGIETQGQLAFLRRCGCDEIQGYLFSEPVSAEGITALFRHPAAGERAPQRRERVCGAPDTERLAGLTELTEL